MFHAGFDGRWPDIEPRVFALRRAILSSTPPSFVGLPFSPPQWDHRPCRGFLSRLWQKFADGASAMTAAEPNGRAATKATETSPGIGSQSQSSAAGIRKPALGVRTCPMCRCQYIPTAAKYEYGPRDNSGESRLKSILYFGMCPSGHAIREIIDG
jgi:hypothetical protein